MTIPLRDDARSAAAVRFRQPDCGRDSAVSDLTSGRPGTVSGPGAKLIPGSQPPKAAKPASDPAHGSCRPARFDELLSVYPERDDFRYLVAGGRLVYAVVVVGQLIGDDSISLFGIEIDLSGPR